MKNKMDYKALYERERKRSEKMKEYIELLREELDESVVIAFTHGWRSSNIDKGQKLRDELSAIEAESGEEEEITDAGYFSDN
jgi:hypothetical protein